MSATLSTTTVNEDKLNQLMEKLIVEMGAAATAPLVLLGDQLGFYRTLAQEGPVTPESLARSTGTHERYVREWLANQAASGYVSCDPEAGTYSLSPEQATAFADENSPFYVGGAFYSMRSLYTDQPQLTRAFRTGEGVAWGNHDDCLFIGVEKFFKPSYNKSLIQEWIPALDGVEAKLRRGGKIADVGCGHGASTILMAKAFPNAKVYGFDFHEPSIEAARERAKSEGVDNITFAVATAQDFPGEGYDLVAFFDCLHDMGDPAGAAARVRETLAPDGTWMIVEPAAADELAGNLHPLGRMYYAFSAQICTPSALSQPGGYALGAQAGQKQLSEAIRAGGLTRIRRAMETPFNIVLEVRP